MGEDGSGNEQDETIEVRLNGWTFVQVPIELIQDNELSNSAFRVFCALATYANYAKEAWPSQERLGEDLGVSERTVRDALAELEARGWIAFKCRRRRKTKVYILNALPDRKKTAGLARNADSEAPNDYTQDRKKTSGQDNQDQQEVSGQKGQDRKISSAITGKTGRFLPTNDIQHRENNIQHEENDIGVADGADAAPPHPPPLTVGSSSPDSEDQPAALDGNAPALPQAVPAGDVSQPHGAHEVQLKRKRKPRDRTAQDDMFDAVAWVLFKADTPDDIALLSKGAKANTGRTAKRLRDHGATVDDLRAWWGWWCEYDWRGQQGQHPTPSQLTDSWPQFEDWRANPAPAGRAKARASPDTRGFGSNGQPAGDGEYPVEKREEQHIVIPESARTS